MQILLKLQTNNNSSIPKIKIICDETSHEVMCANNTLVELQVDDIFSGVKKLEICRDEPIVGTTHKTWVIVNEILIDNYWKITEHNHCSKTIYDNEYLTHAKKLGATWELTKDLYNNVLFFNGRLCYDILFPVRRMFWL